jgi:hypothetical protein
MPTAQIIGRSALPSIFFACWTLRLAMLLYTTRDTNLDRNPYLYDVHDPLHVYAMLVGVTFTYSDQSEQLNWHSQSG